MDSEHRVILNIGGTRHETQQGKKFYYLPLFELNFDFLIQHF